MSTICDYKFYLLILSARIMGPWHTHTYIIHRIMAIDWLVFLLSHAFCSIMKLSVVSVISIDFNLAFFFLLPHCHFFCILYFHFMVSKCKCMYLCVVYGICWIRLDWLWVHNYCENKVAPRLSGLLGGDMCGHHILLYILTPLYSIH